MREAGRIAALVLEQMKERVEPGITTLELDALAEETIVLHGGRPAFKGYRVPGRKPFPATLCTSVNDEVVHGIPNATPLRAGDIVGIDVGVDYQGFYGDTAVTLPVGQVSAEAQRLMSVCAEALQQAIDRAMKPGQPLSEIGRVVQGYAESHGFSVVRDFVGHGVGTELHQPPREVPNYVTRRCADVVMKPGLVIAIEPMINAGRYDVAVDPDNEWVVRTADGRLSAHFEHTVAITPDGCRVLTLP